MHKHTAVQMTGTQLNQHKSWNTQGLPVMEKVWKAQERAREEERKIEQLKKQLEEEKQMAELKRLHSESKAKSVPLTRPEWMYEAPVAGPSSEEYLNGAPLQNAQDASDLSELKEVPGSLWLKKDVDDQADLERKVREDPLLSMRRAEQNMRKGITSNPLKMNALKNLRKEFEEGRIGRKEKRSRSDRHEKKERRHTERGERESKRRHTERGERESKRRHTEIDEYESKRRHTERDEYESKSRRRESRRSDISRSDRDHYRRDDGRRHHRDVAHRRTSGLSESERRKKLEEMVRDGQSNELRVKSSMMKDTHEETSAITARGGSFLDDVRKDMYNVNGERKMDVEDRIRQGIFNIQRIPASSSFMKK